MSAFIQHALDDVRGGRETWRVFLLLCAPAFVVACIVSTLFR